MQAMTQAAVAALTDTMNNLLLAMALCGIIVILAALFWARSIR